MNAPAYEINGVASASERFYAVACDPRRSVVVEACAGAGKTWMLVSRILRALMHGATQQPDGQWALGVAPHEILAITFTKKAAGEMRQRLQTWLQEFAAAPDAKLQAELRLRGLDGPGAEQAVPLLRALYPTLLALDRGVQIRTFHSWFAALLRAAPLSVLQSLELPAKHELLEDDASAVALVWRPFYAALLDRPTLHADYQALVQSHGRHQAKKALSAALSKRVEFVLADAVGVVDESVQRFEAVYPDLAGVTQPLDALVMPGAVNQTLWQAARHLGAGHTKTLQEMGSTLEQALTALDVAAVQLALLTDKGQGPPRKISDKLPGVAQVLDAQQQLLRVQQAQAQHEAWLHQQRMARLTRCLIEVFAQVKREHGWVDMNDVERAALQLLGNAEVGAWVAQRLDAQVRHLLIDEFQDTNPLQWQALQAWLSGYAGSGGGLAPSVFIVGDPKQSIYRFRRAEPQVFMAAKDFVAQGLGGDILSCDHTRRCAPAVLAVVNRVMQEAAELDAYPGFRPHSTASEVAGQVQCLPAIERLGSDPDADEPDQAPSAAPRWRDSLTTPRFVAEDTRKTLEARQAAAWVAQCLAQGVLAKDIMVLARKRDRLGEMQRALLALGIAAQQPEKADLSDAPEVQDMVSLLDALVSPQHDLALARALKSPLFGWSDDDLVTLALCQRQAKAQTGTQPSWLALLQGAAELPAPMLAVGAQLAAWQARLAALPPHDALAEIYAQGQVLERYAGATPPALRASVLANLRGVLAASLQVDASRYATPYALVRALKTTGLRAPATADAHAVRLLTIHGAKGLEAQWVLLLDTDAAPAKAETMSVLVKWPGHSPQPQRLVFLVRESQPPTCTQALLAEEQAERAREELNALYVAMTRAEQGLLLSSVQPHRAAPRSWWQRLHGLCEALAAPGLARAESPSAQSGAQAADRATGATTSLLVLPAVKPAMAAPGGDAALPSQPSADTAQADSDESLMGQAMHQLLEWAPLGPWQPNSDHLAQVAQEFELTAAQAQAVTELAQRIRTGQGAWAWDPTVVDWWGNELDLTWHGQALRLDRLVRRRDTQEWWVLDYKSHPSPVQQSALRLQLQTYRSAVQVAHPGHTVRAAFLSGSGALQELA